jgi:hypothetical protein
MKTHTKLVVFAFGFLVLGTVMVAHATPAVSWQPSEINIYGVRGATTTLSLVVTPSQDLADAVVRVTPEIGSVVAVSPMTLGTLTAGRPVTLAVTIAPQTSAVLGPVEGAIQIRNSGSPGKAYGRALGVKITIDPFPLPPDPGEGGKATLQGIDVNQNGVRDDVERYIAYTYPEPSDAATRAALAQYAIPLQQALMDTADETKALEHEKDIDRATECLRYLHGSMPARGIRRSISLVLLNTSERSRAYLDYNAQLGGHVFPLTIAYRATACDANRTFQLGGAQ